MITINRITVLMLAGFAFFACEKDPLPSKEPYASLDEFFLKNGAPTEQFTIQAENGGTITGSKGTTIIFPAYAFQRINGTIVTGNVTIALKEVYKKSDMVLSRISTASNGILLKSGGMFSVTASQNNEQLYMADGKSYQAIVPASNPDPAMLSFIGISDSVSDINWLIADTSSGVDDSSGWGISDIYANVYLDVSSYVWSSNWLGWCNCDYVFPGVTSDAIIFTLTDELPSYFSSFLVFDNNSAITLSLENNQMKYENAPHGYDGTMVALGLKDSILYSAFVPFTVSNGLQINFTLEATTTDDFKAALDALN